MNFSPRVLHVIPSLSPKRGGPSEAIFPMVRALITAGVRTEIATTDDDGPVTLKAPLGQAELRNDVAVHFFHRFSPPLRALREFAYARGYDAWLKAHLCDYDLIHVHSLFSYVSTRTMHLAERAGVPYVVRPLGQLGRWPLRQSARRKRLYLAMGEAGHLQGAAAVHFTSQAEADEAAELELNLCGAVIPHGMDLPDLMPQAKEKLRTKFGLSPTQKLALFLGRLHPKKGLDLLLAALVGMENACLILAGEGAADFERELEASILRLSLGGRVIRTGFVTGEAKQLLLQGADLFVLTSRHENFGLAVLESLAAGTPVLVSDQVPLAGEVERFELGGVAPLDSEVIHARMLSLLKSPLGSDRDKLRKFVTDHYSWEVNASALSALYAAVIEDRPFAINGLGSTDRARSNPKDEHDQRLRTRTGGAVGKSHGL